MDLQLMKLRKAAGYANRDDFADALGVNRATYKAWETGRTRLKLEDACNIAALLNCTLDELAGRDFQPKQYSDPRQQSLNYSYSMLDDKSKDDLTGIASTFTADASRLAVKSGQGAGDEAETVREAV